MEMISCRCYATDWMISGYQVVVVFSALFNYTSWVRPQTQWRLIPKHILDISGWPYLADVGLNMVTLELLSFSFYRNVEKLIYSRLSLSRTRLSRITAYLEVKIWSLPIHENLTTDGKYCRKEEKLLLRSNFSSFPQYFQYISNFKSPVTYQFVKCG